MADENHLTILRQGVERWNAWRAEHADIRPDLSTAFLRETNLSGANLHGADLMLTNLCNADLAGADLSDARMNGTGLIGANLVGANLSGANLSWADLSGANLTAADLRGAMLVRTDFTRAILSYCSVYAVSAWDVYLDHAVQTNLIVESLGEPRIMVDNLEVAQFLYLVLHNQKLRDVIDTLTSKVVLILGRFTPERKAVLDAICEALRQRNYVPVLFDFDKPSERNARETVTLLARMARFIIADLTEPSSLPLELEAIVPGVAVPVQPLIAQDARPFSMFDSLRVFPWVLPIYHYASIDALLVALQEQVIAPAEAKVCDMRNLHQPDAE